MSSAFKFWPTRLFGRGDKTDADAGFVPTTALAARIVSTPSAARADAVEKSREPTPPTSFDALSLTPEPTTPAAIDDVEVDEAARQADRFVPDRPVTTLTDTRGKSVRARIINVSATGVAVEADFSVMPVDTITYVGQKPVHLGRAIRRGQVFLFDKPLDPARCNKQIVL